jgi:hypothetical protein
MIPVFVPAIGIAGEIKWKKERNLYAFTVQCTGGIRCRICTDSCTPLESPTGGESAQIQEKSLARTLLQYSEGSLSCP